MNNNKILLFLLLFAAFACTNQPNKTNNQDINDDIVITSDTLLNPVQEFVGIWVGISEPNDKKESKDIEVGDIIAYDYKDKIALCIDSIVQDSLVFGKSIVSGNSRFLRGKLSRKDDRYYDFELKEPGDKQNDGIFRFQISVHDSVLHGTWQAFQTISIPKRIYELKKRKFIYNPANDYTNWDFPYVDWEKSKKEKYYLPQYFSSTGAIRTLNASIDTLSPEIIENLSKADLMIVRNMIYAKHGYAFKDKTLQTFFDRQDWYMPLLVSNPDSNLSMLEKQNIELLLRYEKNAAEHYDAFAR